MKSKQFVLITIIWLCFALKLSYTYGQNSEILRLDSLAFHALETNSPNVSLAANKLLESSNDTDLSIFAANAHTILGITNKNKGYYVTAINHYLKALNISEKIKDNGRRSACLNNIGAIYLLQDNFKEALNYFNQSLAIEKSLDQPIQKSIRFFNIGDVYNQTDSLELALSFYTNSLLIEKAENNKEGIVYANLGISEVYIKANQLTDAKNTLLKTEPLLTENALEEQIIFLRLNALIHEIENDLNSSLVKLNQAYTIAFKNNLQSSLPELLKNEIRILEKQGEWKKSNQKYKELTQLSEKLNSVKVKNQLADLSFQNELNKKDLEIRFVKEERDLASQNATHEKNIRKFSTRITWFLVFSILLIIGLLIFGYKRISKN